MPSDKNEPRDKTVRRRLSDGTVKTYTYARRPAANVWTVGKVIVAYKRSPAFTKLAPGTRRQYDGLLRLLEPLADVPIADVKRRHVRAIRDELADTPGKANNFVRTARALMAFALEDDLIDFNPLLRMKALPGGEHQFWEDHHVAALDALPERFRRAAVLALYTGQRASDTVRMTWTDYDGEGVRVVQEKTGARLWIPCHSALRAELSAWPREAVTMLTTLDGRPWTSAASFCSSFSLAVRDVPALAGCVYHGLRKTAAARLAEAGCSTHEIMAITGHASIAMVQHYTKSANQKHRARAAIVRLEGKR
ncbi:MAG: tyrosine-type recombinase/integrase [Azospirillum sp.]|nr:tyrosine-type recombinase/integrase [Azospirillum sp.]